MKKIIYIFVVIIFMFMLSTYAYIIKQQKTDINTTITKYNYITNLFYKIYTGGCSKAKAKSDLIAAANNLGISSNDLLFANLSWGGYYTASQVKSATGNLFNIDPNILTWVSYEGTSNPGRGAYGYFSDPNQAITLSSSQSSTEQDSSYSYHRNGVKSINVNVTVKNITITKEVVKLFGVGYASPLVIDLNNDGKISASNGQWIPEYRNKIDKNNLVEFDINGDGFKDVIEWVGKEDGLLIALNNDGIVDGNDLFGTAGGFDNGFDKLALYDKNEDGIISENELNGLFVWQDLNQNANIDKGELKSLKDIGLTKIYLHHNSLRSYAILNGKKVYIWDWWPTTLQIKKYR